MICCQCFFNSERRAGESFLFGDSERKEEEEEGEGWKRREGWWRMRKVEENVL